jgi:hypothetical protein
MRCRLVVGREIGYYPGMVRIRFTDDAAKRKALAFLAGRFSFRSWATGEMVLPEGALPSLAMQGVAFQVEGPASYEQIVQSMRTQSNLYPDGIKA